MRTKRLISLLLAAALTVSMLATTALAAAAAAPDSVPTPAALEQTNEAVSIRITAKGDMVYGSPLELSVETSPENTQYIGVVLGTGGEANGFVTLLLSEKIRILLKMIPLPKVMSVTPEQEAEFNVYDYLKQLIDGHDVGVLLRVADEVVSVMDVLKFYVPTLKDISAGLKLALNLIRRFLPEDVITRIYLDAQPTDSGNYIAGAVALESGDINTAGIAMFTVKPKSSGVRMYWDAAVPETLTAEQAQSLNSSAIVEADGQIVANAKVSYTYKSKSHGGFLGLFGVETSEAPTEPGEYIQTAKLGGNYSCGDLSRTIKIVP